MTITVPVGFVTDFASVPRLPLTYLIAGNTGHWAATVHDLLYRWGVVSRKDADIVFKEALNVKLEQKNLGKLSYFGGSIRTLSMYSMVRTFG